MGLYTVPPQKGWVITVDLRAVAYLRVSSRQQLEGHSLDAQERVFQEACSNKGWQVMRIYREEGRSAHSDSLRNRTVMRQLLKDAGKGSSTWWWSTPWIGGHVIYKYLYVL